LAWLVGVPAVDHDLLGRGDEAGVEVDLVPVLADRLAATETTGTHEMERRIQPVALGCVEEDAELLRRPHHDRAGDLASLAPSPDTLVRPQEGPGQPASSAVLPDASRVMLWRRRLASNEATEVAARRWDSKQAR
jgi:hypothetical protein